MHNRNYCCYRHFKEGKNQPSTTHCYSHVALGVINPLHSPANKGAKQPIPPLEVSSKPFRIQNRTHDYNEVQHKQSLPNRLKQPRVYVEQIVPKLDNSQPLLPIKHSGSNEYENSVKYFKKIGQTLPQKSKASLYNEIKDFAIDNQLYTTRQQNIFFTKDQFIKFILENFNKFTFEQAQNFWKISFNQLRFKERISMQAFVYNFGKFYLQLQNYSNTFSSTALRQRMIDLRVLLFDWFNNQICFKYNMREMRKEIQQIIRELQIEQNEEIYCDFQFIIEECKKGHMKLKFLAECFFNLTDNKFVDSQKLKDAMKQKIEERARKIQTSREILHKYFETQDLTNEQKFAVTDILEFCKLQNCTEQEMADIISWIQGLFDYLYFNKPEDPSLGLSLNLQTRRLQCANILHINADLIREYDRYIQLLYDGQIEICNHFTALINQAVERMPSLQGPKKIVVECNYMAETLLRFIRSVDLIVFWQLVNSIVSYNERGNTQNIGQIIKTKPKEEQIKKNMKELFTFPIQHSNGNSQNQIVSAKSEKDKVQNAIKQYNRIKQEQLSIKVKPVQKKKANEQNKQSGIEDLLQFQTSINNKPTQKHQISSMPIPAQGNSNIQGLKISQYMDILPSYGTSKYWLQASRETNETISAVESLQSRLFELLDFQI